MRDRALGISLEGDRFDVLRVLGTNGIFVLTGVPASKGPIQIESDLLMRNIVLENQVVVGGEAIELLQGRRDVNWCVLAIAGGSA